MPRARHSHRRAVVVFWSAEQDRRLVELHERRTMTADQIAHEMAVPVRAVRYRASELRRRGWHVPRPLRAVKPLVAKTAPRPRHRWTPEHDATLERMRNAGRIGSVIAQALDVTTSMVFARSQVLGLEKLRRRRAS